jgi:hypothetical protein
MKLRKKSLLIALAAALLMAMPFGGALAAGVTATPTKSTVEIDR